jgi:hypothetical protein
MRVFYRERREINVKGAKEEMTLKRRGGKLEEI